jgi:CHAT domain-containing protein
VADQVGRVVDARHNRIEPASEDWLIDVGAWLWTVAMGPVLTAAQVGELVVVACGLTSALPLHAAWRAGANRRRYALEDVVIRYAPNARTVADERVSGEGAYRSVLAVGNPSNTLPPLRHAEDEIHAIPASLDVTRLGARRADIPEVLTRWESVDIVHFACHGRGSVEDPLSGGVILAGNDVLTAQHVIDRRLDAHPLVILSACETAVIGARLPDEVVSLQSAFLAAGARGVLATLWPVDDELSARLVGCFYRELVNRGRSPAAALRECQRRLAVAAQPGRGRRGWAIHNPHRSPGPPPTWAAFTYAGR